LPTQLVRSLLAHAEELGDVDEAEQSSARHGQSSQRHLYQVARATDLQRWIADLLVQSDERFVVRLGGRGG
jgi:hypothetical protein